MKTTLGLLRERLLKDKEIFPHYNEYINGILYDIDNELLAMEKEQMSNAMLHGWRSALDPSVGSIDPNDFYNKTFKSE